MNNLNIDALLVKHFRFCNDHVTAIIQPSQAWFDFKDVCRMMGYQNTRQAIKLVNPNDLLKLNYWDVQKQMPVLIHEVWGRPMRINHYFVNEFGIIKLLSRHLEALNKPVCHRLVHQVVPSVVPTNDKEINNQYRHHKHYLMRFSWKMFKAE